MRIIYKHCKLRTENFSHLQYIPVNIVHDLMMMIQISDSQFYDVRRCLSFVAMKSVKV